MKNTVAGYKTIERFKESTIYFFYAYFVYNIEVKIPVSDFPKITWVIWRSFYTFIFNKFFPGLFQDSYIPKPYVLKKNKDYGNLVYKGVQQMISPITVEELQQVLNQANKSKTPIHFCGSGHSSNGLTLSENGGLRLYLKKIQPTFRMVSKDRVEFRGIATILQLAKFLYQHNRYLPVVGDQLHLTLGGFLSSGGGGYNSVEHGFLSDHVVNIELLTATGNVVNCSASTHPSIFHGVLGGQGQLGIIIGAQIKVIERRAFYLRMDYCLIKKLDDLNGIINRMASQKLNYLFMTVSHFKGELEFSCLTGKTCEDKNAKISLQKSVDFALGKDHKPIRKVHKIQPKYNRLVIPTGYSVFENLTDKWLWSEYILPLSKIKEVWRDIEALLNIKQSLLYFYLSANKGTSEEHTFLGRTEHMKGTTNEPLIGFGLSFSFYALRPLALQEVKEKIGFLYTAVIKKGGKPYYNGYHPQLRENDMRRMYPKFDEFLRLKSSLDPNGILNPGWIMKEL